MCLLNIGRAQWPQTPNLIFNKVFLTVLLLEFCILLEGELVPVSPYMGQRLSILMIVKFCFTLSLFVLSKFLRCHIQADLTLGFQL